MIWQVCRMMGGASGPHHLYIYFYLSTIVVLFWSKCFNFVSLRATQKQKYSEQAILGVQYKNLLAPQATPKESSNMLMTNKQNDAKK